MHKIIITIICAVMALGSGAATLQHSSRDISAARRQAISDSIKALLPHATNARDSLHMLYDLFDLSTARTHYDTGMQLYNMEMKLRHISEALSIMRHVAYLHDNDTVLNQLLTEVRKIPESDEQQCTELYIRMKQTMLTALNATDEERQRHLTEVIKEHAEVDNKIPANEQDLYELIFRLNDICSNLKQMSPGELLTSYLIELGRAIRRIPKNIDAINNLYYTQLADIYSYVGDPKKSVEADQMLIRNLQRMRNAAVRSGRKYCNFDMRLFLCYRRMLSNYAALTPDQIEKYYNACENLMARNADVAAEALSARRARTYYLMATHRYQEAIETMILNRKDPYNEKHPLSLLRMLMTAAKATGNDEVLLNASQEYIATLEEYAQSRSADRYNELRVMYDVSELESQKAEIAASKEKAESTYKSSLVIVGAVFIVLLLILLAWLVLLYRRSTRLTKHLAEANAKLTAESENLHRAQRDLIAARDRANSADNLKTEFINNMSHEVEAPLQAIVEYSQLIVDTVSEEKKGYLTKFASIVTLSADLLQTLINDVLTINSIDSGMLSIKRMPVSAKELCSIAVETESKQAKPGVKVIFENAHDESPATITTDSMRVEQVLLNLVNNAVKFTQEGTVSLRYDFNDDRSEITFTVTDTGIGINEGEAEKIFERFYKGNKYEQGVGLGLSICRLVAKLLGGKVWLDTSYTGGACFKFTLPVDKL